MTTRLVSFVLVITFVAGASLAQTFAVYSPFANRESEYGITYIVSGPDGGLWFAAWSYHFHVPDQIGRIAPDGVLTEFPVPMPARGVFGIAVGPDGALWFTESRQEANAIGRMSLSGSFSHYPLPRPNSWPDSITTGPDGALWFTERAGRIGRLALSGSLSEYDVPWIAGRASIIAAGPDGALWFTAPARDRIGRITTSGVVSEYQLPTGSFPYGIARGPDDAMWFTQTTSGQIGRITMDGTMTHFSNGIPQGPIFNTHPQKITAGPDGAMWFTIAGSDPGLGRITVAGEITTFSLGRNGYPDAIAELDGAMWFADGVEKTFFKFALAGTRVRAASRKP